jgi:hypothetical protein
VVVVWRLHDCQWKCALLFLLVGTAFQSVGYE